MFFFCFAIWAVSLCKSHSQPDSSLNVTSILWKATTTVNTWIYMRNFLTFCEVCRKRDVAFDSHIWNAKFSIVFCSHINGMRSVFALFTTRTIISWVYGYAKRANFVFNFVCQVSKLSEKERKKKQQRTHGLKILFKNHIQFARLYSTERRFIGQKIVFILVIYAILVTFHVVSPRNSLA